MMTERERWTIRQCWNEIFGVGEPREIPLHEYHLAVRLIYRADPDLAKRHQRLFEQAFGQRHGETYGSASDYAAVLRFLEANWGGTPCTHPDYESLAEAFRAIMAVDEPIQQAARKRARDAAIAEIRAEMIRRGTLRLKSRL